ncbi:MAG: heme exporter protein CcmB [Planctomycetota bacterium]
MKSTWMILWKDLRLEWRTKEALSAMMVFGFLVIVLFNFSFNPGAEEIRSSGAGLLWIAFTFAGTLGMNRSFAAERENGCLQSLLMAPIDRSSLFLGKWAANFLFMTAAECFVLPAFLFMFNVPIRDQLGTLIGVSLLGTLGFTCLGTLLAGVSMNTRMREVLLPVLLFPISIPLLLWAVETTSAAIQNAYLDPLMMHGQAADVARATDGGALKFLVAFDMIFGAVCTIVFPFVVED